MAMGLWDGGVVGTSSTPPCGVGKRCGAAAAAAASAAAFSAAALWEA